MHNPNVYPALVYCVAYRADFSTAEHHTGYVWNVRLRNGQAGINPQNGTVATKDLVLERSLVGPLAD